MRLNSDFAGIAAQIGRLVFVLAAALGCGFVLTAFVSNEPLKAYGALLTGAWPDIGWNDAGQLTMRRMTRLGALIEDATTLTFLGLAVAIPFRARQFSMGGDGRTISGCDSRRGRQSLIERSELCIDPGCLSCRNDHRLSVGPFARHSQGPLFNEIVTTLDAECDRRTILPAGHHLRVA